MTDKSSPSHSDSESPQGSPETLKIGSLLELSLPQLLEEASRIGVELRKEASRPIVAFEIARRAGETGKTLIAEAVFEKVGEHGFLRWQKYNFLPAAIDVYVSPQLVRKFSLRPGWKITGICRKPEGKERQLVLISLLSIEEVPIGEWQDPPEFDKLTATFPQNRILLEESEKPNINTRAIDLIAPLGKGQRGLIVAPPRTGKTILLKHIARAIRKNHPEIKLILLLIDERPEEVTDLRREIDAEIYSSTFDESPSRHVQVAEITSERAKRLVELKYDVVVLLDSITRMARSYNNLQSTKGRTMSGGVDSKALMKPKRFFGAARNVEEGGSLTILATALVETHSRMDDLIFEEFKGTGNMELYLDRSIVDQRIFPAIHILKSATRREEMLYHPDEFERIAMIRKQLSELPAVEAMQLLVHNLEATDSNPEFLLAGIR
ncbi:MAG: transcription termination factor Rho [Chthoniobacterales bacterium]